MIINYLLILVCVQCVAVNSRNYIIYAPSNHKLVEKKKDIVLRMVKSAPQSDGASQHILNLQLILPRAAPQETHNPLQALSMAQQNNNNSNAVLRSDNQLTGRRLASKADLVEAFAELRKRQQARKLSKENPNNCSLTSNQANILPLAIVSNEPNPTSCKKPNDLKDIIEIIKGGLNVNNQVPQTTEKLSWMKIRVPRKH